MTRPTYFVQECPVCGRRLQIRVEYLGRRVACQHCQGWLTAADPSDRRFDNCQCTNELLRRANELLDTAARRSGHTCGREPR